MKIFVYLFIALFLFGCATDPGTNTPISGSSITKFTYETGEVDVIINYDYPNIKAAAVLFDINSETLKRTRATELDSGVTITWPEDLTFNLPGCASGTPLKIGSETQTLSKLFDYTYPTSCTPPASGSITAVASLTVHKEGQSDKVLNGSGGSGGSGGGPLSSHTIFLTDTTYTGNLGGLDGADSKCRTRALASPITQNLGGEWRAILSDSTTDAISRITFSPGAPLINTVGATIKTLASTLWAGGGIEASVDRDAGGAMAGDTLPWTGTLSNGLKDATIKCSDWVVGGAIMGGMGDGNALTILWVENGPAICTGFHSLYCVNSED